MNKSGKSPWAASFIIWRLDKCTIHSMAKSMAYSICWQTACSWSNLFSEKPTWENILHTTINTAKPLNSKLEEIWDCTCWQKRLSRLLAKYVSHQVTTEDLQAPHKGGILRVRHSQTMVHLSKADQLHWIWSSSLKINTFAVSQFAYLYYALKVGTLFVKKMFIHLSA